MAVDAFSSQHGSLGSGAHNDAISPNPSRYPRRQRHTPERCGTGTAHHDITANTLQGIGNRICRMLRIDEKLIASTCHEASVRDTNHRLNGHDSACGKFHLHWLLWIGTAPLGAVSSTYFCEFKHIFLLSRGGGGRRGPCLPKETGPTWCAAVRALRQRHLRSHLADLIELSVRGVLVDRDGALSQVAVLVEIDRAGNALEVDVSTSVQQRNAVIPRGALLATVAGDLRSSCRRSPATVASSAPRGMTALPATCGRNSAMEAPSAQPAA